MPGQGGGALALKAAQHRIDQLGQASLAAGAGQVHGRVHGGMVGRAREQQLCGTQPQDVLGRAGIGRQGLFQAGGYQRVDLAQAAQGRGDQIMGKSAAARVERREGTTGHLLVEGLLAADHALQQVEGRRAGIRAVMVHAPVMPGWRGAGKGIQPPPLAGGGGSR